MAKSEPVSDATQILVPVTLLILVLVVLAWDELLLRDVSNVLAFFRQKYGIERDAAAVVEGIRKT